MIPRQGTAPDPVVLDEAYRGIIEFGVVGCILAVVLISSIALVWWVLRSTSKALREKDQMMHEIGERRFDLAIKTTEAITKQNSKLDQVVTILNQVVVLFDTLQFSRGGRSDDPKDPR